MSTGSQALPEGLQADWAYHPRLSVGNDPGAYGFSQTLGWGVVYKAANGSQATNTAVEVRSVELRVLSKSTGQWTLLQNSDKTTINGAMYAEDFANDANSGTTMRKEADGGISVVLANGKDFHFWPDNTTKAIDPNDIAGVLVSYKAKLVVEDPSLPDDRGSANYVAAAGADYWNSTMTANGDAGIGRFKTITNDDQTFTMSTLTPDQLAANPPTDYINGLLTANVTHSLASGKDYASYDTMAAADGTVSQQVFYNADGSIYDKATFTYGADGTTVHHTGLRGLAYTAYDDAFNKAGVLTNQTFYKADGTVLQTAAFTALSTGLLVHFDKITGQAYASYDETRDAAGAVIKDVYYNKDGSVLESSPSGSVLHHTGTSGQAYARYDDIRDAAGNLVKQVYYDANGRIQSTVTSAESAASSITHVRDVAGAPYASYDKYTDADGTTTKRVYYTASGSVYDTATYTYSAAGTVTHYSGLSGLAFTAYDDTFDASGALTKQVYFNGDGSVTQADYTYSPNGSVVHVSGLSGAYASYDKVVNTRGAWTDKTFYRADGSVYQTATTNATGNGSVVHYAGLSGLSFTAYDTYSDANGNQVRQVFYNGDGIVKDTGLNQSAAALAGQQTLVGTSGADIYNLANLFEAPYSIADFSAPQGDKLALKGSSFGLTPGSSLADGVNLLNGAGARPTANAATFLFDTTTHNLSFDPDGAGAKGAVLLATLTNANALHAANFAVV